jgi:hypothetical protein
VIYRALTRQQRQDDTLLLLNDQSGSVLGDSTVFSWAGCHTLQGPSWHALPHDAPRFFAGRECTGRWSSPNFASILLASSDDTSALHSGGRTQNQGETMLSTEVAMVLSLDLASRRALSAYL